MLGFLQGGGGAVVWGGWGLVGVGSGRCLDVSLNEMSETTKEDCIQSRQEINQ